MRRGLDPMVGVVLVTGALVAAGAAAIAFAWRSIAASASVVVQLPYAVSGAVGGIALIGFALGVATIQAGRRAAARDRAEFDRVVTATAELLAAVRGTSD